MKVPPSRPHGVFKRPPPPSSSSTTSKTTTSRNISRARKRQANKSLPLALALDNEHLNRQLRSACDDHHALLLAHRAACEQNEILQNALSISEMELQDHLLIQNRRLQDMQFRAMMEQEDVLKQLQSERTRLSRKMAAERNQADEDQKRLRAEITQLQVANTSVEERLASQTAVARNAIDEAAAQRVSYLNAMAIAKDAFADLECAKQEVNSVREDLADLLRLDTEEVERAKLGLPPAYGGLNDADLPPWQSHCQDVGRLDGGAEGHGMTLLESVAEENFSRELRKALAMAGKLRQSRDPAIKDVAGAGLFRSASLALANACASLVSNMDKVVQLESTSTSSLRKRPLPISIPPTTEPAFKRPYNSKQRHVADAREDSPQPPTNPPPSTSPTPTTASNHTLAHRAVIQTFSLIWQLLAAFDLRPIPVILSNSTLRLQLASSWRVIDDNLCQVIGMSAKSPLTELDEIGRCEGCCMKGCAGNCIRLARLQGYVTQLDALMRGLRNMITIEGKSVSYLGDCSSAVEDLVAVERRCAAEGRGGTATRHVEFLDLTNSPEMDLTHDPARPSTGISPSSPSYVASNIVTDRVVEAHRSLRYNPIADGDSTENHIRELGRLLGSPNNLRHNLEGSQEVPRFAPLPTLASIFDLPPQLAEDAPREPMRTPPQRYTHERIILESPTSPISENAPRETVLESPYSPGTRPPRPVDLRTSPGSPVESVSSVGSEWLPPGRDGVQSPQSPVEDEHASPEWDTRIYGRFVRREDGVPRSVYGEGGDHPRGIRFLGAAGRLAAQRGAAAADRLAAQRVSAAAAAGGRVRREGLRPRNRRPVGFAEGDE